jgi:DNA repair photolyase
MYFAFYSLLIYHARMAAANPGRGTDLQPKNRFERLHIDPSALDLDSDIDSEAQSALKTEYFVDATRTIVATNDSPDVGFSASVNPYRGCEHGCIYCYARPTHEYFGLSAGLDFESKIFVKPDAPLLLRAELSRPSWTPQVLAMSGVTDCYQPAERALRLTRGCLEVLAELRNPVGIVTKNALVTRDLDVLRELAQADCANVTLSVTTLDESLRRVMEPRASRADLRLDAIARLNDAGIPAGVMIAPVIPGLNDHEIPAILERSRQAGASFAGYVLLRLPFGVKALFEDWLERHFPDRKNRVLGRIEQTRGGKLNDPRFGSRMRGEGPLAALVEELFVTSRRRAGFPDRSRPLRTDAFRRPGQLALF